MYVTSDIYDLKRIARFQKFDWRENLIGGVVVHGTQWRGYQAGARFLLEATRRCGIAIEDMEFASYSRPGDRQSRRIKAKSFEKLIKGELAGASNAIGLLLGGQFEAIGVKIGVIWAGGEAWRERPYVRGFDSPQYIDDYPYASFHADFVFPFGSAGAEKAVELLRLAIDALGAEYGYYFVRDEMCFPSIYATDSGAPSLDHSPFTWSEVEEKHGWCDYIGEGRLWTEAWPIFRDLYQVNLISERHTQTPLKDLGYLLDWIGARPGRGRLEELGDGRWLWSLTDQEMVEVRPQLNAAGALYSCSERVYRDIPEGAAVAQRLFEAQRVNWAPWVSDARRDYPGRFPD
jgi:hypothetical protein